VRQGKADSSLAHGFSLVAEAINGVVSAAGRNLLNEPRKKDLAVLL
jgi:hypothetical protein